MIPITEAVDIVRRETPRLNSERITLAETVGRVLAEDIVADMDLPPFDRSQMDGYAVRAEDTANSPVSLRIAGESAAGHGWHNKLKSGEAVRIMTGAPVPDGADAVQKLELAREKENGGFVEILEPVVTGKFIVNQGSEIRNGETVFSGGEIISHNMIAGIAGFGYTTVLAAMRPKISIMSTGSEVVDFDQTPGTDQIRNSNSIMLDALSRKCAGDTTIFPIGKDEISDLKSSITNAANGADILIITGGVSVGKYDLTKPALKELGAEVFIDKLRLKPGKPMVFARLNKTLVFGLPGNPVSAAVTFYLIVRQAILQMQGANETGLSEGTAVMASAVKAAKERDTYLPATLQTDESGHLMATSLKWQGSSDFIGFSKATALIAIPMGETREKGSTSRILFL